MANVQKYANTVKIEKTSKETNTVSVCDLFKGNTTRVIRHLESTTPIYIQLYSDFYTEYLHMLEDLYGTCYIAEKQFFDKLGIDQKTSIALEKFWTGITDRRIANIDMYTNFRKSQFEFMTSFMKSYNHFVHLGMDYYAAMISELNSKNTEFSNIK